MNARVAVRGSVRSIVRSGRDFKEVSYKDIDGCDGVLQGVLQIHSQLDGMRHVSRPG